MNKQKPPRILTLAILTVVTVAVWIGFDVYRALTTKPAPPVPPEILAPIDPQLNINVLSTIVNRVYVEPKEGTTQIVESLSEGVISTPVPTPVPTASPIATSTPSPTATP